MKKIFAAAVILVAITTGVAFAGATPGDVLKIVNQLFGAPVNGQGATNGQALVYDSTSNSWKPGAAGGSQTLAQTLVLGNTTGATNLDVTTGQGLSFNNATFLSSGASNVLNVGSAVGSRNAEIDAGSLSLQVANTAASHLSVTGNENTTSGTVDYIQFVGGGLDSGSNSTSVFRHLRLAPTFNYTGATRTGHYEALSIGVTETSLGTGTNYLIRAMAGAAGTTDKFNVTNLGQVFAGVAASSAWSASSGLVLDTESNSAGVSWTNMEYNTATPSAGPVIAVARARGTVGSPTATQSGDSLGGLWFGGYGTSFGFPVQINAIAAEGFDGTHSGADLRFSTLPIGAAGGVTERWWMTSTGNWIAASGLFVGWTSGVAGSSADTGLSRQAAGVVQVINPSSLTSSAAIRVYNTTDSTGSPTNAEWLETSWSGNACTIQTAKSGTGTNRNLTINSAGSGAFVLNGSTIILECGGSIGLYMAGVTDLRMRSDAAIGFSSSTSPTGAGNDVQLTRSAAGVLSVDAGTPGGAGGSLKANSISLVGASAGIAKYNNVATAGWGVPAINASGRATAQTAAKASLATFTPAADGSFEVVANVLVTTATSHSFQVTCTYTDEGNTARTLNLHFAVLTGTTFTQDIVNANGAVPYHGVPHRIRAKAGTAITIQSTGTFTTVTYNIEADIKQVS